MKRFSILAFAFALALITVGCGGGQVGSSTPPPTNVPSVAGGYQFVFTSINPNSPNFVLETSIVQNNSGFGSSSGYAFDTCAVSPCASNVIDTADSGDFNLLGNEGLNGTIDSAGTVNFTDGLGRSATGTFTAKSFSGTYAENVAGGDSGTWVATKTQVFPATATFNNGAVWTLTVTGTTATLNSPSINCTSTFAGNILPCTIPEQERDYFIVIPDSSVPAGFDLAWYSINDIIGDAHVWKFLGLLTDTN